MKDPFAALLELNLPLTGADSHAHLDSHKLWPDFEQILDRARRTGIRSIGQIFLSHAAYLERIELMSRYPELFFMLGVHPTDGHLVDESELDRIDQALTADPRLRAIGEIGLDFYWKDCPRDLQEDLFVRQLRLAKKHGKPVVIHSRDAFEETLSLLDREDFAGRPLLWHCFGGDRHMVRQLVERGWHISIPGPVTYPANHELREAVALIPDDRIMVETDCPYLAPQPLRGKRNEPAYCAFTAQAAAQARECALDQFWTQCGDNTRRFFGLETQDPAAS